MSDQYLTLFNVRNANGEAWLTGAQLLDRVASDICDWAGLTKEASVPYFGEWQTAPNRHVRAHGEVVDSECIRWRLTATIDDQDTRIATEVRLATVGSEVEVRVSERATGRLGGGKSLLPGRPDIVPRLLAGFGVTQFGEPLDVHPALIDATGVNTLERRLSNPNRQVPIIIVSSVNATSLPLVDPLQVADDLAGLANVVRLVDTETSFRLADLVGKVFCCYDGAVRIYWPGFVPHHGDDPYRHPLFLATRIQADPGAVRRELFTRLCRENLHVLPPNGPIWRETGQRASVPLQSAAASSALRATPDDHVGSLVGRWERLVGRPSEPVPSGGAASLEGRSTDAPLPAEAGSEHSFPNAPAEPALAGIAAAQQSNDELIDLMAEQERRISRLESSIEELLARLEAFVPEAADAAVAVPGLRTLAEAIQFADATFPRLKFLGSARKSARKSLYRHPNRLYSAFEAMQDVADERAVSGNLDRSVEEAFAALGQEYAPHISPTAATRFGNEYLFPYKGERVLMESHLKLGTDRDPTNCLRIHFEWDAQEGVWVIGHVGEHPRNTKT